MFVRELYRDGAMRDGVVGGVYDTHTTASRLLDDFILADLRWCLFEHGIADYSQIRQKSYSKADRVHIECVALPAHRSFWRLEVGEASRVLHIWVPSEFL